MTKYVVAFWLLNFGLVTTNVAQKNDVSEETQPEISQLQSVNQFEHLISVDRVVYQLRKKYGIRGSVELSRTLWNILISYNNQEQSSEIWQSSLNAIKDTDKQQISPSVNFNFITGQILSRYTRGMNMQRWLKDRNPFQINNQNINLFLQSNDELLIYLHLEEIWKIILINVPRHENINWHEVFQEDFDLFSASEISESTENNDHSFINSLLMWDENANSSLPDQMQFIQTTENFDSDLFLAYFRFHLNKQSENYVASVLNWQELAYLLYYKLDNLSEAERGLLINFIEQNKDWFVTNETRLRKINPQLLEMIQQSSDRLQNALLSETSVSNTSFGFSYKSADLTIYDITEPDFNNYMTIPFRQQLVKELEVCLNISREIQPFPQFPISRNQFSGCINDMVRAATQEAKSGELAGELNKIDTKVALDRALELPPWQIVNIIYADKAEQECLEDNKQLTNPLEWSLAAESILWFTDRWPNLLNLYPEVKTNIQKVVTDGEIIQAKHQCLNNSHSEILNNDFDRFISAWQGVKAEIKSVAQEYASNNLREDSDINLLSDTLQKSSYKVKDAQIKACDAQKSCGVHIELDSSRALFGLFPNNLLIADQLKLGNLKLCYDNVGWENRRAAPTHLDNDNIADYYGNLSFSLKGYYNEDLIFEKKITDEEEYHYLFASSDPSVLQQYCPLPIVGSKISTRLKRGTFGLVPNRLTFLTASRADESKILASNWLDGQEWRDKFISENASDFVSDIYQNRLDELTPEIRQSYQQKASELSEIIYKTMLNEITTPSPAQQKLADSFTEMKRSKQLLASTLYLMQPDGFLTDDKVHHILFGDNKLVSEKDFRQYYENRLKINEFIEQVEANIETNQNIWNEFDKSRSNSYQIETLLKLISIN